MILSEIMVVFDCSRAFFLHRSMISDSHHFDLFSILLALSTFVFFTWKHCTLTTVDKCTVRTISFYLFTHVHIYIYLNIWEPVWSYLSIYGTDSADTSVSVNLSIFWNLWLKPHTRFLYDTVEIGIGSRFRRCSHRDHRENLWHRVHRGLLWHIESSHGLVQQKIDHVYRLCI